MEPWAEAKKAAVMYFNPGSGCRRDKSMFIFKGCIYYSHFHPASFLASASQNRLRLKEKGGGRAQPPPPVEKGESLHSVGESVQLLWESEPERGRQLLFFSSPAAAARKGRKVLGKETHTRARACTHLPYPRGINKKDTGT